MTLLPDKWKCWECGKEFETEGYLPVWDRDKFVWEINPLPTMLVRGMRGVNAICEDCCLFDSIKSKPTFRIKSK